MQLKAEWKRNENWIKRKINEEIKLKNKTSDSIISDMEI